MASTETISQLYINNPANSLDGTEKLEITKNGHSAATTTQAIANLGGGGLPYKVYTAILNQTGTSAPVATVLQNSLGGTVVWTRSILGQYHGDLTGAFTPGKTLSLPMGSAANGAAFIVLSASAIGYAQITVGTDPDRVVINTYSDLNYTNVEWSNIGGDFSIEIRVYT